MFMMLPRCGSSGFKTGYLQESMGPLCCDEFALTPDCGDPVSAEP